MSNATYEYAEDRRMRYKDMLIAIVQGLNTVETLAFYLPEPFEGQALLDLIRETQTRALADLKRWSAVEGNLERMAKWATSDEIDPNT